MSYVVLLNDCSICAPQEVFPTEYGLSYDTDMQLLVWEFLSKLEKLLPVPDLSQVGTDPTYQKHVFLVNSILHTWT